MSLKKVVWLLAISIFALSVNASEDDKVYRVEILVFQNLDESQMEGENWRENPGYPRFEKAIKLLPLATDAAEDEVISTEQNDLSFIVPDRVSVASSQNVDTTVESEEATLEQNDAAVPQNEGVVNDSTSYWVPYQSLSEDELYLKPFRDRLLKSDEYLPMRLSGWVQSVESREQARAVYLGDRVLEDDVVEDGVSEIIDESNTEPSQYEAPTESLQMTPTLYTNTNHSAQSKRFEAVTNAGGSFVEVPLSSERADEVSPVELPSVEGIVRVSKATYFHVDVDMALNRPVRDTTVEVPYFLDDNWQAVFRLFESRRIKLEQINYFDHPAFGVLVYVSEIKPSADDEATPIDSPTG